MNDAMPVWPTFGDRFNAGTVTEPRTEPPRQDEMRGKAVGVGRRFIDGVRNDDVAGLAAELAYRFLFAVFPFGLFVAALGAFISSFFHVNNPAGQIVAGLGDNLPPAIGTGLRPDLERLLSSPRADLLSVGAIAALWAATGGTNALVKGMHRAYEVPESRPFIVRYLIAIGLTLLAAVGVIASFVTIVGGALATQQVAAQFGLGAQAFAVLQLLRYPAVFLALTLAVTILYRYAPSVVVPWRWVVVGAAFFTIGWLVATAGLGYYASNVANYGATYGSLGAVIVLMLWFYVTAALLLIGAELTAALARERAPELIGRRGEEAAAAAAVEGAAAQTRPRAGTVTRRTLP
jgi:membrane protein